MKTTKNDIKNITVSIRCLVYNHASCLRKCLDGFVMQQTDFRFEAIVHDDASTDGSVNIIREYAEKYPNIIKPIIETENQYSKHDGSLDRIMADACTGKYIAWCEGDDCWTDTLKLQKQVSFLESHPDYVLSHTDLDSEDMETGAIKHNMRRRQRNLCTINKDWGMRLPELILQGKYSIQTLTVVARREEWEHVRKMHPSLYDVKMKMGDTQTWLALSTMGKVHYLPESTATYHVIAESATHSKNYQNVIDFHESCLHMVDALQHEFNLNKKVAESTKRVYVYYLLSSILIGKEGMLPNVRKAYGSLSIGLMNQMLEASIHAPHAVKRMFLFCCKAWNKCEHLLYYWKEKII